MQKQIQISRTLHVLHLCFGDLYFFWCEQDLWAGAEQIWRLALLCYQRHWLSQIAGKWCHLWAVSAVDLGYIPLTSRVNAKAMEKKKHKIEGCCERSRSTCDGQHASGPRSPINLPLSPLMAERDESLPDPPPSHLIHMSICPLSMPLSKDYWCPAFDLSHIMCYTVSANEVTQSRWGRIKPSRLHFSPFVRANVVVVGIMASPLTSAGLIHQSCR